MSNWHPTVLQMPPWLGQREERGLPLWTEAYQVIEEPPAWWRVIVRATGETVYSGVGPIEIAAAPLPF